MRAITPREAQVILARGSSVFVKASANEKICLLGFAVTFYKANDLKAKLPKVANSVQVGGTHYKAKTIQPWDYIIANDIPFLEANVIKYVTRWREKNGKDDLLKAKHYLEKLIEVENEK